VLQKILKGITQKRKIKATMKVKERINVTRWAHKQIRKNDVLQNQ
jgi:hypothetical protein